MAYSVEEKREIVISICDEVVEKNISFNTAIFNSPITLTSFYQWVADDLTLQKLYNYARILRSDCLFEEIIDIADKQEEGEEITQELDSDGCIVKETKKRGDMIKQRKLKIEARQWVVAKMQPKKYGDKVDDLNEDKEIKLTIEVVDPIKDEGK